MEENLDDVLAELNGEGATPQEATELKAASEVLKTNPLEVKPPAAQTAVQKRMEADKKKAGVTPLRGYAVTVVGKYTTPAGDTIGKKITRPYEITVNLPTLEGALSTIKNKLLDKMLRMKYPGYITYLTHEIKEVRPLSPDTPESNNVEFMTPEALLRFVEVRGIPVELANYDNGRDIKNLRASVVDYLLNTKDFTKREERRVAELKEDKALADLNPAMVATSVATSAPVGTESPVQE